MSQREQQTARVNVDDATWQTFRIRAIQADCSVADELGRLVRNDLRQSPPAEPPNPSTPERPATKPPMRVMPRPDQRAPRREARDRSKQRLADLDPLTELPRPPAPTFAALRCGRRPAEALKTERPPAQQSPAWAGAWVPEPPVIAVAIAVARTPFRHVALGQDFHPPVIVSGDTGDVAGVASTDYRRDGGRDRDGGPRADLPDSG